MNETPHPHHTHTTHMITLQYFDGTTWITVSEWTNERIAWISLGADRGNYRTVANGEVIKETDAFGKFLEALLPPSLKDLPPLQIDSMIMAVTANHSVITDMAADMSVMKSDNLIASEPAREPVCEFCERTKNSGPI